MSPQKRKAVPEGTAKFREETSKKDSEGQSLIAVRREIGGSAPDCKQFFALQHCDLATP